MLGELITSIPTPGAPPVNILLMDHQSVDARDRRLNQSVLATLRRVVVRRIGSVGVTRPILKPLDEDAVLVVHRHAVLGLLDLPRSGALSWSEGETVVALGVQRTAAIF